MFDVTVSVWNENWSRPLIAGFSREGCSVRALGTGRRRPDCDQYEICWSSTIATRMMQRFPRWRRVFVRQAMGGFDRFAARNIGDTRCFWCWYGTHIRAIRAAKKRGVPVVLESGSTHIRNFIRVMADETSLRWPAHSAYLESRLPEISSGLQNMSEEVELADFISVPSAQAAESYVREGVSRERIFINNFGVDADFWRPAAERRGVAGKDRPFVFVYAAHVMLRKGIGYLAEAWRKLAPPKGVELWIVGLMAEDAAPIAFPEDVKVLGALSHEQLRDVYARCDIYLLPSLEEGLARSVLEAMAAGLPVIVTPETGAADIMVDGEDGWMVPAADASALCETMGRALSNSAGLSHMGDSARRRVQPCTWEAYGRRAAGFLRDSVLR